MHHWAPLWGHTWSPCFQTFPFSPVLHTAARLPFLEPSAGYITALLCWNVISSPVSNQIKSSGLGGRSWCYPPWSQSIFPWKGAASVDVAKTVPGHVSKPWIPFHESLSHTRSSSCSPEASSGSSRISIPGVSSLHIVHPWMLRFPNASLHSETPSLQTLVVLSHFTCVWAPGCGYGFVLLHLGTSTGLCSDPAHSSERE